jgi:hypothetical protein
MRDIGHCPMWQGQLWNAKPHWGCHLCTPRMPVHALRALKLPKLLLVLLRVIWDIREKSICLTLA